MALIVYKSQLGGVDFAAEVEKFRQALLDHRFTGNAAPHAHSLVEAAIRRVPCEGGPDDFVADFVIVDDTPPPPSAAERKSVILARLQAAESAALDAVMPAGKLRLLVLQANAAFLKLEADRTDTDRAAIAWYQAVIGMRAAVELHAATVHAAIDDLSPDQYETFQIAAFPLMSVADLKTRLADVPGIETLAMTLEAGRIMLRWGWFANGTPGYSAAVDASAADHEIEAAVRNAVKLPPVALIPDKPTPAPFPAAPKETAMSVTGASAAGQSLRELMDEHKKTLADLTAAHMDKMREGFSKQLQGVNALGKLADKVHSEGDEFLALIGQYTNDLGV